MSLARKFLRAIYNALGVYVPNIVQESGNKTIFFIFCQRISNILSAVFATAMPVTHQSDDAIRCA
jgi:Na+-transporting NADH:ubiquinone oxidoreductase subunit NqrE